MKVVLTLFTTWLFLVATPSLAKTRLQNGSPLATEVDKSLPRQTLLFSFWTGAGSLPATQQGLSSVLLESLEEGPSTQEPAQYRDELFRLNADINFAQGARTLMITVNAPPEALPQTVLKLKEILSHPRLDKATYEQSLQKVMANAQAQFQDMRSTLAYFAIRDAFRFHPDILDGSASVANLSRLKHEDLKPAFARLVSFSALSVAGVGPMQAKPLAKLLNTTLLQEDADKYRPQRRVPMKSREYQPKEMMVTLLNKPGATDNQVLYLFAEDYQKDKKEAVAGILAHEILGGGMNGLLAQVLRTERGLTYFAGSRLDTYRPYWLVASFAGVEQLPELLRGIPELLKKFKANPATQDRLKVAKSQELTQFRMQVELPEDRLIFRNNLNVYGLDPRFVDRFEKHLQSTTLHEVRKFVERKMHISKGHLYVMGDQEKILPQMAKAGLSKDKIQVVELDAL